MSGSMDQHNESNKQTQLPGSLYSDTSYRKLSEDEFLAPSRFTFPFESKPESYYIKDRSLKDVGFIRNFILFLCKFHIHKCKFTKGKPIFMVLEKEIKMYVDVMSKSKNSKAVKMINI